MNDSRFVRGFTTDEIREKKTLRQRKAGRIAGRSGTRRRVARGLETLEKRNLLTFAIDLVADINQLGISSNIDEMVTVGDEAFFVADDGQTGSELWKTDGTETGTVLVKDILPGPDASAPESLTVIGSEVFFVALDVNNETDLWKTDGTESGTVLVFDADAADVFYLTDLTESNGKLFFTAYEQNSGYELWVSDGTSAGTQLVLDINPDQSVIDAPQELTDVDGTLFFTSYEDGYYNRELWKSDGTAAGTMMVADLGPIDPGDDEILGTADDIPLSSNPEFLTNINGVLYFAAEDDQDGIELFKSDGTESGTVMIADLNPNGSSYPQQLTEFNGDVFFSATNGVTGQQLYKSNGTTIDFVVDTSGGLGPSVPTDLTVFGGELYFASVGSVPLTSVSADLPILTSGNSRTSSGSAGVFTSVAAGDPSRGNLSAFGATANVDTINQGDSSSDGPGWVGAGARIGDAGVSLTTIGVNDLYIRAMSDGDLATKEWDWVIEDSAGLTSIAFNGFASGNEYNSATEGLLFELFLNDEASPTTTFTVTGDALDNWFGTRDSGNISISNAGGASVTKAVVRLSIGNATFPNYPSGGTEAFIVNASLTANLSAATTQVESIGRELHKTDGTSAGTETVIDIVPMGSSNPSQMREVGGKLFFSADDVLGSGEELWVTDGLEGGTIQVIDSRPGLDLYGAPLDGAPTLLGELNGELLFTTTDSQQDRELWLSDGTQLNTFELASINPSTAGADVNGLLAIGDSLFFAADDGLNGEAIYRNDTTTGIVQPIVDVSPSSTDRIIGMTTFDDGVLPTRIVFFNNSLNTAGGVYISDTNGTFTELLGFRPVELDENGKMFVVADNTLFFVADDGNNGTELWKSDGTAAGTMMVADLFAGSGSSSPRDLVAFDGRIYFSANDDINGREIFSSDGSTITLKADINLDEAAGEKDSSSPEQFVVSGSRLFFTANDGSTGRELYAVNEGLTIPSVSQVADLRSGGSSSDPLALTDVNGLLYFTANNGSTGYEPYLFDTTLSTPAVVSLGNLNSGSANSFANGFFPALGEVYFSADGGGGQELWKTDTTSADTSLVADVQSGPVGSQPELLFDTGTRLIFSASSNGLLDRELWVTDGTSALTEMIEDLYPSEFFGSEPGKLIEINDVLYFAAADGMVGRELFQIEVVAPTVQQVSVGGEVNQPPVAETQRSTVDLVSLTIDGPVDVNPSGIQLVNTDTNTVVSTLNVATRVESNQTIVELTFAAGASVISRDPGSTTGLLNSLADGNYRLTVAPGAITSPLSGVASTAEFVHGDQASDAFFRLFGDRDGDRDVDLEDYGLFGSALFKSQGETGYDADLDFDGDFDIDAIDFGNFRRRLGGRVDFAG